MTARVVAVLVLLTFASCAKNLARQTRDQVRTFDGADLKKEDVEIVDVQERGDHAVVEIRVRTAVKMARKDGKWVLEEVRLADRRWEKTETILNLLEQTRSDTTSLQLQAVAGALRKYREEKGEVPPTGDYAELMDFLFPAYLEQIIRIDAWSRPFAYRKLSDGGFELRSAGSDGKFGTSDDLVLGVES